jgi:hypothetical protein
MRVGRGLHTFRVGGAVFGAERECVVLESRETREPSRLRRPRCERTSAVKRLVAQHAPSVVAPLCMQKIREVSTPNQEAMSRRAQHVSVSRTGLQGLRKVDKVEVASMTVWRRRENADSS